MNPLISIVLLILSFHIYRINKHSTVSNILLFCISITYLIISSIYSITYYLTGKGINYAAFYHFKYGLKGAGFLEYKLISFITIVFLTSSIIFLILFILKCNKKKSNSIFNTILSLVLAIASLITNPFTYEIYNLQSESSVTHEDINPSNVDSFNKHYINTKLVELDKNHKNLVYIYAESFERTYFNEKTFPNLVKELKKLEKRSTYFTNIKQVYGTGWTIGGMVASQCGIPLYVKSGSQNSMAGIDNFLPSAISLGKLLKSKGYNLNYMGGSKLHFAGKDKFLKTHGFNSILGRNDLIKELDDKKYINDWGIYDDSLFEMLYNKFIKLSEDKKPFGLFTLTLDTHSNRQRSSICEKVKYSNKKKDILNAISCTDYLISKFVNKLINSKYSDNTIIVISSDHLVIRNTAYKKLSKMKRENLFMIIDPTKSNSRKVETIGSTLDIGSTILPFLGYKGNIGLGRDLLDDSNKEEERLFIHSNLKNWKYSLNKFWSFPKFDKPLSINIKENFAKVDNAKFEVPVLIELNKNLESSLIYNFYTEDNKDLSDRIKSISKNNSFLLIDHCRHGSTSELGLCLSSGKSNKIYETRKLKNNVILNPDEIKKLLKLNNK